MLKFCFKKSTTTDYDAIAYTESAKNKQIQEQIEINRCKLDSLNSMKRNLSNASRLFSPNLQSTHLQPTNKTNMFLSGYEYELTEPYGSLGYESETLFSDESMFTNSSIESQSNKSIDSDDRGPETVYVCVEDYDAHFQGDLSLKFSEQVHVLCVNDDFTLIKRVGSDEKGYVPTKCLTLFSAFIKTVQFV